MKYKMRFYGSCGHIVEYESKELFDEFSMRNLVVEENGAKITLVHPYRYCCCEFCIKQTILIYKAEEAQRQLDSLNKDIEEVNNLPFDEIIPVHGKTIEW